ncbi:MAG: hypothetical protein AWU57_1506 [Marinobacter sp. T13-3]|mgnify:CR=1 FL=1|nr:MAG: hypothetical protein AWU57_1506 [Marinobacter sp. T13-3]
MSQENNEANYQPRHNVVIWWLSGLACLGLGGGVVAPLTADDLMLDFGYGILMAKIIHGFILGIILGISISFVVLGFSGLWVSVRRYMPGAASVGTMFVSGAFMLGTETLLEPAPSSAADSFEQMAHDITAMPLQILMLVIVAFGIEALVLAWHRHQRHEQQ